MSPQKRGAHLSLFLNTVRALAATQKTAKPPHYPLGGPGPPSLCPLLPSALGPTLFLLSPTLHLLSAASAPTSTHKHVSGPDP